METKKSAKIPRRDAERDYVSDALLILRRKQPSTPDKMLELAKKLKSEMHMNYARRLLLRASKHETLAQNASLHRTVIQQLALCTYKDQDLLPDDRFQRALNALKELGDFATTKDQETLGLLGAIYKRKWEVDNQRPNIELSLRFYLRGYDQGPAKDQGYTGINAAFVLDLLADLLDKESKAIGESSGIAETNRAKAREIRLDIIKQVEPLIHDKDHQWVAAKWWYYSTIGEAYFGLGEYDKAAGWLIQGQEAAGEVYEWELETCARQLANIARFQDVTDAKTRNVRGTSAWAALQKAFGSDAVPRTAFAGKVGLALSGGGLRASLYHLGVLARLAELDMLRNVEVLSCVSGGSIVGAYYYLMVRRLLQTKTDEKIEPRDYADIVKEMIEEFVAGVQENIRTRVLVNPLKNFRMLAMENYSRTNRAGELYEKCLYARIKDGEQGAERWLNKLTIAPLIKKDDGALEKDRKFSPKYQNWRRDAKVPILVLNAATLNTGHTWQFTATWMGESPNGIDSEIDDNDRLRRMYYTEAPAEYQQVRLGDAVGSSAAVPGLFEPMTLDKLFPDRIVRLVDGGVCDNQGIGSLFEQDCRVMLVSDASGQMESQPAASRSIFGVLLRSNDIFQARIRLAEYHDLKGRRRSGLLRGLMFVHLKEDLEVKPIDWIGCNDPYKDSDDARLSAIDSKTTRYGIPKDLQRLLSDIRTDLDSFSDAEAYSLMLSGYRITDDQFKYGNCVEGFSESVVGEDWKFFQVKPSVEGAGEAHVYLMKLLKAGGSLAFKVWQIDPWLRFALRGAVALLGVSLVVLLWRFWTEPLPRFLWQGAAGVLNAAAGWLSGLAAYLPMLTMSRIVFAVASLFSVYLLTRIIASVTGEPVAKEIVEAVRFKDTLRRVVRGAILGTVGCAVAAIHIYIFDRRFLHLGSIAALKRKK